MMVTVARAAYIELASEAARAAGESLAGGLVNPGMVLYLFAEI